MSISEIVDAEYRLQPADVAGRPCRLVITNVSYQGVEQLAPVLHFEGMTKRLVLSADCVRDLVNLSGTPIFSNWIGITVVLESSRVDGVESIGIVAAENSPYAQHAVNTRPDYSRADRLILVTVGVVIVLGLLYALRTLPVFEQLLSLAR